MAILLPAAALCVPVTLVAMLLALEMTGAIGTGIGGALGSGLTSGVGHLFGSTIG